MIRALILIVGLLTGLLAAVFVGGRVAHLRMLAGDALPHWVEGLDADAGLSSGSGQLNGALLRWRLEGIDLRGPSWSVSLAGSDWQVQAQMRAGLGQVSLGNVQGLLPGAAMVDGGTGAIAISDGGASVSLPGGWTENGWIEGRANALVLVPERDALSGDLRLTLADGVWSVAP